MINNDKKLPAIIVDMDGTLAHAKDRDWHDYKKVHQDTLDVPVATVVRAMKEQGYKIVIVTGRNHDCKEASARWLYENNIPYDMYIGREPIDKRQDANFKKEAYRNTIEPLYDVLFVIEDRDRCVEMWRELGLKCLQPEYGNF